MVELYTDTKSKTSAYFDVDGSIIELPTRFIRSLENTHSAHSIDHYSNVLLYLMRWIRVEEFYCGLSMDEALRLLTRTRIEDYLHQAVSVFTGEPLAESTKRSREVIIKALIDFAATAAGCFARRENDSPWSSGRYITKGAEQGLPKALSERQIIDLLNGFHNESERTMIHAAWEMGMRASEFARMTVGHLPNPADFPADAKFYDMTILGSKGRGGQIRERKSLISVPLYKRIQRYHANDDVYFEASYAMGLGDDAPVFLTPNGLTYYDGEGKPKTSLLNKQLDAAAKRAGLDPEWVHFHVMRHSSFVGILTSDFCTGADADSSLRVMAKENHGHKLIESGNSYARMNLTQMAGGKRINRYEQAKRIVNATCKPYGGGSQERRGHRHL